MDPSIVCVECGGIAHLMTPDPPEGLGAGDVVVYACEDCSHRLDIVVDSPAGENPAE